VAVVDTEPFRANSNTCCGIGSSITEKVRRSRYIDKRSPRIGPTRSVGVLKSEVVICNFIVDNYIPLINYMSLSLNERQEQTSSIEISSLIYI